MNICKAVVFWNSQYLCAINSINWILVYLILINVERVKGRVPAICILIQISQLHNMWGLSAGFFSKLLEILAHQQ